MHRLTFLVAACGCFASSLPAADAPKLLPFQGRLTDSNGSHVPDGARVVQFKIYNAPVGGQAVWSGEVQKLTVNGGLVNTMLGSKVSLASVDFNQNMYLELTLDANNDGQITLADPPLLPRQSILPAVFAKEAQDSRQLDGYDWSVLFGTNNPAEGALLDSKIRDGSLTAAKIFPGSLTSNQIAAASISSDRLAPRSISAAQLVPAGIGTNELAKAVMDLLVPPGSIMAFAGESDRVPDGWLPCDGRLASISAYPRLFAVVTNRWGTNSATEFRIPDLRGVFLRGVSGSRSDGFQDPGDGRAGLYGSGASQGVGSYQRDELKSHAHTIRRSVLTTTGDNANWIVADNFNQSRISEFDGVINPSGGSETRPKNAYVNYIIKY